MLAMIIVAAGLILPIYFFRTGAISSTKSGFVSVYCTRTVSDNENPPSLSDVWIVLKQLDAC